MFKKISNLNIFIELNMDLYQKRIRKERYLNNIYINVNVGVEDGGFKKWWYGTGTKKT
jgi:hypothetical protein